MQLEKNELSEYASYNYLWTLAVLSDEEVNTASYLNREPQNTIIKSGGHTKPDSLRTYEEEALGINVEFFIDELEISSIYSPNPKTGVTTAVNLTFKVYEPYSVGMFFQTMALASIQAGYNGEYSTVPLLLRCEFKGYDSTGNVKQKIVRDLVISLVNSTFKVDAGGAVYNIEAIPWNHLAWGDETQKIKTDDKLSGYTVEEVLSIGERSLVSYLNKAEEESVANGTKTYKDEYVIEFPDSLGSYLPTTMTTKVVPKGVVSVFTDGAVASMPRTGLNSIGSSVINDDFNYMGNQEFALDLPSYDSASNTVKSSEMVLGPDRLFTFRQGTPIDRIIEQVILTSKYTKDVIEKLESQPDLPLEWFRIETQVFFKDNTNAKQFVYRIIPYVIDRSLFVKQGEVRNYDRVISNVKKGYNYIYTGLNSDIINFDININLAFFQPFLADANSTNTIVPNLSAVNPMSNLISVASAFANAGVTAISQIGSVFGLNVTPINPNAQTRNHERVYTSSPTLGGAGISDTKTQLAKHFHEVILNSDIELITVNLEVMGDPYFMPDSGMGNHTTERGMEYQENEVDIILHFSTPVDMSTTSGKMSLSSINQFIGLYKIIKITHSFNNGQFKQTLEMLRRPGQDQTLLDKAKALLIERDLGQTVPGLSEFIASGSGVAPSSLIYGILANNTGVNSFLNKMFALQNISNILPLPDDLLKVFNTINNFGTKVVGITNAVSQIVGDVESVFKNTNSLFKTIQSGFQNNVLAIASTASSATTKVSTIKPTTPTGPTFGPQ